MWIKIILKYLGLSVGSIILIVLLYLLCSYILSRITVKAETTTNRTIICYIVTNGVHTDIVVPVQNTIFNWSTFVHCEDCTNPNFTAEYIAFGWGDKGFYLETPTWSDLKFSTAFNAVFGLSTSAMHVTWYLFRPTESETCKEIVLSEEQYRRLIQYIKSSFTLQNGKPVHMKAAHAHYGQYDTFYDGVGKYNLFFTCNTWANSALKEAGQKCALWTPFDSGIFNHYQKENRSD